MCTVIYSSQHPMLGLSIFFLFGGTQGTKSLCLSHNSVSDGVRTCLEFC